MHTPNKFSTLLVSLLLCMSVVIGFVFTVRHINDQMGRVARVLSEIGELTAKADEYRVFERIIKTTEADREKIASYVIKKDGLVDFIKLIEKMAVGSGVEVIIKTVVESGAPYATSDSPKVMLTLPLSATGTWENISMFFALLDTMPYKTTLTKVDLKRMVVEDASDTSSKKRRFSKSNPGWQADFEFGVLKSK